MHGRRVEHPHNTPEQIVDYLRSALELVAELNPPDDLRVAAFTKAADLFSSKHVTMEQVVPGIGLLGQRPGL